MTLTYGYDAAGNRTSLTDSLGGVVSDTYDERNELVQETQSGTGVASERADFVYDAAGNRTSLTRYSDLSGSSVVAVTGYTYDDANRLTNIATLNASSGTISSYAYTLDAASRLTQEVRTWDGGSSSDTITYGYTDNGQLTGVSHTNGAFSNESYSYDANGNRTMTGYSTDTGNELAADGTYNYTYDAAGNMTSRTDIATGVETDYVWDDRNRLVEVDQVVSGVNTVLALYTYDALNNPIKVVEDGSTRWTVYDGNRPVLDFDGSGTLTARYLQGPMVDEVLARDTPSGGVAWYLPDRLGTVRDIIDNSGTVLDHIAYDAYGQILSQSNASAGDRFGYAGMQTDATTGLYFDQARWYDPQSGRFIGVDPTGFAAEDTDLYRYVGNRPTNATDPSGHQEITWIFPDGDVTLPAGPAGWKPWRMPDGGYVYAPPGTKPRQEGWIKYCDVSGFHRIPRIVFDPLPPPKPVKKGPRTPGYPLFGPVPVVPAGDEPIEIHFPETAQPPQLCEPEPLPPLNVPKPVLVSPPVPVYDPNDPANPDHPDHQRWIDLQGPPKYLTPDGATKEIEDEESTGFPTLPF